jgi:uridylate kinase
MKNRNARKFEHITYQQALRDQLKVMDAAAFSLCQENNIPILVFNFFKENEILRAVTGARVGTLVDGSAAAAPVKRVRKA